MASLGARFVARVARESWVDQIPSPARAMTVMATIAPTMTFWVADMLWKAFWNWEVRSFSPAMGSFRWPGS